MADSVCWVFVEERTGFGAAVLADAAPYQTTSCFSRIRCPARNQALLPGLSPTEHRCLQPSVQHPRSHGWRQQLQSIIKKGPHLGAFLNMVRKAGLEPAQP